MALKKFEEHSCSCGCESGERERHSVFSVRFFVSVFGFVLFLVAHIPDKLFEIELWYVYIAAYLLLGYNVIIACFRQLFAGKIFNESFLMTLASAAALALGDFTEAVAVMLFYQLGQFFLTQAVRISRAAVKKTGEAHGTHEKQVVDLCCDNGSGLTAGKCKCVGKSTSDELGNDRDMRDFKPDYDMQAFVSRFAKLYTPAILICAALLSLLLPLIKSAAFVDTLPEILPFLVLACPCGIVISVPLAYFAGSASGKDVVKIRRVALENIVFILLVKAVVLVLGLVTELPLFLAIFSDVGVAVLAILNSTRLLIKNKH